MGVTGSWYGARTGVVDDYQTPIRWGDGIAPIHALRGGPGRDIAPGVAEQIVPAELTDDYDGGTDYGYVNEDGIGNIWGYGFQTGTADRSPLGVPPSQQPERMDTGNWPSYGPRRGGMLAGSFIRSINKGADTGLTAKAVPLQNPIDVIISKPPDGPVNDSVVSSTEQLFVRTSMTQRDAVRNGSQTTGRENAPRASIASRIVGMKEKAFDSSKARHAEMLPKSQDWIVRPWWSREVGTGPQEWLDPNTAYESKGRVRVSPDNPAPVESDSVSDAVQYGYVGEDSTW